MILIENNHIYCLQYQTEMLRGRAQLFLTDPRMCFLMGKRLAVFLNSFLLLHFFGGLKMQKSTFLRKNGFEIHQYFLVKMLNALDFI